MNKQQFLDELRRRLTGLPQEELDAFYKDALECV